MCDPNGGPAVAALDLPEPAHSALHEFSDRARAVVGARLQDLLLFGSHARGNHGPDSDLDVALIVAEGPLTFDRMNWELAGVAGDILVEHGVVIDAVLVPAASWAGDVGWSQTGFIAALRRDGVVL